MDSKKIGEALAQLRGEKRREQVAADLGVSVSAIAMYENGDRIPRDEMKVKIAKYYGKTVCEIFFS